MPHTDKLLALVGQLYDVVLEPHRWPPLLEAISDFFGGAPVLLGKRYAKATESDGAMLSRINSEAFETFMQHYRAPDINPLTRPHQTSAVGRVLVRQAVIDDHTFRKTVVYNELFYPSREIPLITVNLVNDGSVRANLGIRAIELDRSFETGETRALEQLIPHLQRVLQLEWRLARSQNLSTASAEALDRLHLGAIVVDAKGRVLSINQRAAAIVELVDGLEIVQPAKSRQVE